MNTIGSRRSLRSGLMRLLEILTSMIILLTCRFNGTWARKSASILKGTMRRGGGLLNKTRMLAFPRQFSFVTLLRTRWDLVTGEVRSNTLEAKYVYWLRPSVRESQRMTYGHGMSFRTETCRGDPDHAKRQIRPSPLRLVFTGGVTTDFMWSQYSEAIATPRVAEAFREGGVTGCKFVPVELENTMG